MTKMKDGIQSIKDKVALAILIWLEKEPSQERILPPPQSWEVHGPYLRYRGAKRHRDSILLRRESCRETSAPGASRR
jgi:hypothetical protein